MSSRAGLLRRALRKCCAPTASRERVPSLPRLKSGFFEIGPKGSGFARCSASKHFSGKLGQEAIAGVDEVGMSPLAGPVAAAAVIFKPGTRIFGIHDSKKLDANSRESLAEEIKEKAASWSVAFVEVEEIDTINIYWAGTLAMRRAVEGLGVTLQHLLIDAKA